MMTPDKRKIWGTKTVPMPEVYDFMKNVGPGVLTIRTQSLTELLNEREPALQQVLRDEGLNEDWRNYIIKKPEEMPEPAYYAIQALWHMDQLVRWINKGEIQAAVLSAMRMEAAGKEIQLSFMEPDLFRGYMSKQHSKSGGETKNSEAKARHLKWQKEADQIWKINKKMTKSAVALRISTKFEDGTVGTIRKAIAQK